MANATRLDLRNLIRGKLMSWPDDQTTLNAGINASVTTFTLAANNNIQARSILEVDSELIYVLSVTGTTINNCIRGYMGTTAATHSGGATVKAWPFWGWSDTELNRLMPLSFDWAFPDIWYPRILTNTFLANAKEFGAPAGCIYPNGEIIKKIELMDDSSPSKYKAIYNWRHINDMIILDKALTANRGVRLTIHGKHQCPTDDNTQLQNNDPVNAVVQYTCKLALENLLGNRPRYVEYSAALNDRASTPDELQRAIYFFFNQAELAKQNAYRAPLAGFASTRREA